MNEIHIIGTGSSVLSYNWQNDATKWTVGSAFDAFHDLADVFFCFHGEDTTEITRLNKSFYDLDSYPLETVVDYTGSRYFTSSIAYMIALAISIHADKIKIIGVDMETGSEWDYEKPCVMYWIGHAVGLGIEVEESLTDSIFIYGYDREIVKKLLDKIDVQKKQAIKLFNSYNGVDEKAASGFYGKISAYETMFNTIRS